jgi:fluoride ion exporter CrcB/FEX
VLRYLLSQALSRPGVGWPWATFLANITGGLLMVGIAGFWISGGTAAITRLDLTLGSGNYLTGTTFTLYGLP